MIDNSCSPATSAAADQSCVVPFYLTGEAAGQSSPLFRGRLARLFSPAASILNRHAYPDSVSEVCAEMMSLAACLSTTLKFEGVFTVQAKGDGAVKTLFADVTSGGHIRSFAAFDDREAAQLSVSGPAVLPRIMGAGYVAFTIAQAAMNGGTGHRYQGIVELEGPHLGDCAVAWFKNSEQLASHVITVAQKTDSGWQSAALFLQQIAEEGGQDQLKRSAASLEDEWHTAMVLMSSAQKAELLDPFLRPDELLFRLFHANGLHVQSFRPMYDHCRCSAEKVESMLRSLSPEQRKEMSDESGDLIVNCEFCKTTRSYNNQDFL
jgi:molecular chaperone Hsp33